METIKLLEMINYNLNSSYGQMTYGIQLKIQLKI